MKKIKKKAVCPHVLCSKLFLAIARALSEIIKDKKNPGRRKPILWKDGKSNVRKRKELATLVYDRISH